MFGPKIFRTYLKPSTGGYSGVLPHGPPKSHVTCMSSVEGLITGDLLNGLLPFLWSFPLLPGAAEGILSQGRQKKRVSPGKARLGGFFSLIPTP